MADREREDIASDSADKPAPQRKADDPLARAHRNAAIILAILTRHFPDVRWGGAAELTFLALVLEQTARWARARTPQAVGRARYQAARRKGAAAPPKPAQIWPPPDALIDYARDKQRFGRETFAERQFREGLDTLLERNEQHLPLRVTRPRLAAQGPLPTTWGLAVRDFAPFVAATLAQHGGRVTTGPKAAFTKACRDLLAIILPGEKLPALSTLSDALRKILVTSDIKQKQ